MPPKAPRLVRDAPLADEPEAEEDSQRMDRAVVTPETEVTTPRSSEEDLPIEVNIQDADEDAPVLLSPDEIVRCMQIKYIVDMMIRVAMSWVQRISGCMAMAARLPTRWVLTWTA